MLYIFTRKCQYDYKIVSFTDSTVLSRIIFLLKAHLDACLARRISSNLSLVIFCCSARAYITSSISANSCVSVDSKYSLTSSVSLSLSLSKNSSLEAIRVIGVAQ
ncbi:MAG: hypothetical protein WCG25_05125 [bacterium]